MTINNQGDTPQPDPPSREESGWVVEVDDGTDYDMQNAGPQSTWTSGVSPGEIFGDLELVRLVGRSKTTEVWQALDPILKSHNAVRILSPQLAAIPETLDQYFNEGRDQTRLHHPAIVQVSRVGKHGKLPFFVMEWVDGEKLSQRLKREKKLLPQAACNILFQIISALGYALDEGIIHGNLNPTTILLENPDHISKDRRTKIKVKGFAQKPLLAGGLDQTRVTSPVLAQYMSPETITGITTDHRSDIYCLGLLFYHMLSGETPFHGSDRGDILFRQVHDPLPEPPELRQLLGDAGITILRRMTEKRQSARYQTYAELTKALQALSIAADRRTTPPAIKMMQEGGEVVPEESAYAAGKQQAPGKRQFNKMLVPVAVTALAVMAVLTMVLMRPGKKEEPGTSAPPAAQNIPAATPVTMAAATLTPAPLPPDVTVTPAPKTPSATVATVNRDLTQSFGSSQGAVSSPDQPGIITDNAVATAMSLKPDASSWKMVGLPGSYQNSSLLATADGTVKSATFLCDVPTPGVYEILLWWLPADERLRSSQVLCSVNTLNGTFKGTISQVGDPTRAQFNSIGKYPIGSGMKQPLVTISTEGMPGNPNMFVSVDAVKLVKTNQPLPAELTTAAAATPVAETAAAPPPGAYPPGEEDLVIEAAPGGKNRDLYREISGKWIESKNPPHTAKSSAEGCTTQALCGSKKYVFAPVGSKTPAASTASARFSPSFSKPGRYNVYVTWPHGGNVNPVNYVVTHADGVTTRSLKQDGFGPEPGEPNNSNVWIRIGEFNFKPGSDSYLDLVMLPGARPTHPSANGQVYADAVRFTPLKLQDSQEDDTCTTRHILMQKGQWKKQ